jgi:hypothetical protein
VVFVAISPFAFLILLIWIFFCLHFSQVCQGSVNLVYFFKEPAFCFIDFLYFFSISFISSHLFIISFLLLVLGFAHSSFSKSLRSSIRSLI